MYGVDGSKRFRERRINRKTSVVIADEKHQEWRKKKMGYDIEKMRTFGEAIEAMRVGAQVRRVGWNGKGIFCAIQNPDEHSKMSAPYIYIDTTGLSTDNPMAPKVRVPWLASQTDMLARDWVVK